MAQPAKFSLRQPPGRPGLAQDRSVPRPVPPSEHGFKYRLVFVRDGVRVVGYDNERGKGDHRHLGDTERPYRFKDVPKLLDDFMRDVEASK